MEVSKVVVLFEFEPAPVAGRRVTGRMGMMWVAVAERIEMRRAEEPGR